MLSQELYKKISSFVKDVVTEKYRFDVGIVDKIVWFDPYTDPYEIIDKAKNQKRSGDYESSLYNYLNVLEKSAANHFIHAMPPQTVRDFTKVLMSVNEYFWAFLLLKSTIKGIKLMLPILDDSYQYLNEQTNIDISILEKCAINSDLDTLLRETKGYSGNPNNYSFYTTDNRIKENLKLITSITNIDSSVSIELIDSYLKGLLDYVGKEKEAKYNSLFTYSYSSTTSTSNSSSTPITFSPINSYISPKEKKKSIFKIEYIIVFIVIPVILIIIFLIFLFTMIIPSNKYDEGYALVSAGKYEEAVEVLDGVDYKYSKTIFTFAKIKIAIKNGDYEGAIDAIHSYKDHYDSFRAGKAEIEYSNYNGFVEKRETIYSLDSSSKPYTYTPKRDGYIFKKWEIKWSEVRWSNYSVYLTLELSPVYEEKP